MDNQSGPDLLSDLPLSIIECILTLLPIRDAIRTSILSSKWRYRWASIPYLVFDDDCAIPSEEFAVSENSLKSFITHALLLHKGPIHKFKLSTSYLQSYPDVDQWLLFLSRNDIRELFLELGENNCFRIPSCLFSCQKLTQLELFRCELDPPPSFKGFLFLKSLLLQDVLVPPDAIENLVANCPLLENLTWSYFENLEVSINAPNLKYLCLEGEFKEVCFENTPLLAEMDVTLYMNDDTAEQLEQRSYVCNFSKFLGGLSNLQRLIGHVYFTKYLSIGIDLWHHSLVYHRLKVIELYQVSFEDTKEILVVLRLIMSAPNLHELQISGSPNAAVPASEAPEACFWDIEDSSDCALKQLKVIKITDICGVPHEMKFIKFLLRSSPVLETMIIKPYMYVTEGIVNFLTNLLRFRRSSPNAEILFDVKGPV